MFGIRACEREHKSFREPNLLILLFKIGKLNFCLYFDRSDQWSLIDLMLVLVLSLSVWPFPFLCLLCNMYEVTIRGRRHNFSGSFVILYGSQDMGSKMKHKLM